MFDLLKTSNGARIGEMKSGNKSLRTPAYVMISDFGGGGTNVSRLATYLDLFESLDVAVLFTYYYLNLEIPKKMKFNVDWLRRVGEYSDIVDFFKDVRDDFAKNKKWIASDYDFSPTEWNPITVLDSGSGNMVRDYSRNGQISHDNYDEVFEKVIVNYHAFAESLSMDIVIAMDFAEKQTMKNGEASDKNYIELLKAFHGDPKNNLKLLDLTLDILKSLKFKHMTFAPLHGNDAEEYGAHLERVLEMEKEKSQKFDGFAIGGALSESKEIWGIPTPASTAVKSGIIYSSATKTVRTKLNEIGDTRPIHVLGKGSIKSLIPLVAAGADTFDCHTAWRRASDGNKACASYVKHPDARGILKKKGIEVAFPKFLIPVLDSKGGVISNNKQRLWEYVILPEVGEDMFCDCDICKKYDIEDIKEMYENLGEDNYLARILIFRHAVCQHEYLCDRIRRCVEEGVLIDEFVDGILDEKLARDLRTVLDFLRSEQTRLT